MEDRQQVLSHLEGMMAGTEGQEYARSVNDSTEQFLAEHPDASTQDVREFLADMSDCARELARHLEG